jgi:hypothetical protein
VVIVIYLAIRLCSHTNPSVQNRLLGPSSGRRTSRGSGRVVDPPEEQRGGVVLSTLVAAIDVLAPVTQTLSVSAGSRKSYAARPVCGSAGVVAICLSSSTLLVVSLSSSLPRSSSLSLSPSAGIVMLAHRTS